MNCPTCQTANPDVAKFCMNCGARLDSEGVVEKPQFNINRYLPQELVTKLEAARSRNTMVGERRVITMLFCDVKGSTAAAEKVDPEIWTDIMNGVFEFMIRPIYKYEGLVPRLMGDAILAFFGAPITHEDDPQRAILAGLEIQQGIKTYADEIRLKHGLEFGLRVGINTGLVVVGEIGSDLRMEYTAIGDAINLAARMEQTAQVGTIQISDETYKLVAPFFDVEPLGEVEVKGKSAPINTYRVIRAKEKVGQLRGLEGMSTQLVGRETQLGLLNERLENLRIGVGSFVTVLGEAGLGKSTLIAELKKLHEDKDYRWLRGDALSYARSISYFPWRQVIRQSIGAQEADSPADVRAKLRYECDCCSLPGGDVPFLQAMLAVESEESLQVVTGFQGEALIQRMIEAVRGYLCGLAGANPLSIIFDDLHWADEASLNLLLSMADLTESQPIVFICMSRPDKAAPSWDSIQKVQQKLGKKYSAISLEPLQAEQTDLMLANLLGMKDMPKNLRDLIVEKAQGNPFFVEELIRSLIETQQIARSGENNHWEVISEDAKISLPNTLRGVLSARIDRLPETSKHVLQNASVIGRAFDLRVLKRLTSLNGGFDSQIQYLQEASMIEPARDEYAFRHVLIQEAAYESILLKKRAELHKQIGETLEELHSERLEEFAPLLAYHFYSANDSRSLKYDIIAGEKSARLYANAEAATYFRRALEVAKRTNAELDRISRLHTQLGSVLEQSAQYQHALQNYNDMLTFARDHQDRSMELSALMAKATLYSTFTNVHNSELSEKTLIQALAVSQEIGDTILQARLNWNLMLTFLFSKRLDQSLQYGEAALELARKGGNSEYLAFVLNDLCRLYTCRGEFEKAHAVIREARELWKLLDNRVMLADSLGSESETFFNEGVYAQAVAHCLQALKITEEINNLWGQAYDQMLIAFAHFQSGQLGQGIQFAEKSASLGEQAGMIAINTMRCELAWIYAYCGAYEKGFEIIDYSMQQAQLHHSEWVAFPQAVKVRMHLLQGDIESAERTRGGEILKPISIPYARFTIFLCLANIELAFAKGQYDEALALVEELLEEVTPLTRVDIPEALRWKGLALIGLNRFDEALQVLTQACSLARDTDSTLHLCSIVANLADVHSKLGMNEEARLNRSEARTLIDRIAESLREVGLRDSFLNQPHVQRLMR